MFSISFKTFVLLILCAVYFSGNSTNHGATISYAYFRW